MLIVLDEVKSDSHRGNNMKNNTKVIDYLAEELKREDKQQRMAKLVVSLKAKAAGAGR
jgi:hypothetical protein